MEKLLSNNISRRDWDVEAERQVRQIVGESLKDLNRDAVARKMQDALGRSITGGILYGFTRSATKGRVVRFPMAWAPAFCAATGNYSLLRWFLREALHGFPSFKKSIIESSNALKETLKELGKMS